MYADGKDMQESQQEDAAKEPSGLCWMKRSSLTRRREER